MDKGDLAFRHSLQGELFLYVLIDIESPVIFRRGHIAEDKLRLLLLHTLLPDISYIFDTDVYLAPRIIRKLRVHQALVESDLPAI